MICEYGCENEAQYFLKTPKKWCCSESYNSCPIAKEINRITHLGSNNYRYGNPRSEETKLKISLAKKGKQVAWNKGLKGCYSEETIKKMSQVDRSGPNNPNWKGGISAEPYCDIWLDKEYKESIKERDGYMCLNPCCLKINDKLVIHHIDYNKKNCGPFNLITLCLSCNGRANGEREWYTSWYQAILYRRFEWNKYYG